MPKLVVAIREPDPAALDALVGSLRSPRLLRAVADQGRYGAGHPFDALLTGALEDSPGRRSLESLGRTAWAWLTEEHVVKEDGEAAFTMVAFMRRNPALTHEAFATHWTRRHAPLALRVHVGLCDYRQNVVVETLTRTGDDEIDGVAELGFPSRRDFETRFYDSDAGRDLVAADVRRFMAGPGRDTTLMEPAGR